MGDPRLPFIIAAHNSVIVHRLRTTDDIRNLLNLHDVHIFRKCCQRYIRHNLIYIPRPPSMPCQLGFLPPPLPLFQLQILQYFLPFFAHGDAIHSSHSHNNISGPSSFCAPYTHSIILRFRSQCQQQNRTHISAFAEWR